MSATFACPPDCGRCCSNLARPLPREEAAAQREWRDMLREQGIYHCGDAPSQGLAVSNQEADALRELARARGMAARLHPRTFLLDTKRRLTVVLDWHLAHGSCPFLSEFRCTAYEQRPLVCRAYPVMAPAPRWTLAPACPETAPTLEARATGAIRLGALLKTEAQARRQVEARHERIDEMAWRLLDEPGARYAKGLHASEARERARRYRVVAAETLEV